MQELPEKFRKIVQYFQYKNRTFSYNYCLPDGLVIHDCLFLTISHLSLKDMAFLADYCDHWDMHMDLRARGKEDLLSLLFM